MRKVLLALLIAFAAVGASTPQSIWDGVYTAEQAKRGEELYPDGCSRCHGEELEGDEAPALRSEDFLRDWKGLSLGSLFVRVQTAMPYDQPGSLSAEETADVIAYVLSRNRIPAGKTPMPTKIQSLNEIRMDK